MEPITVKELIAKGRTAEVYAVNDEWILKLFYDWCPTEWIEKEAALAERISSFALPSPKFIGTYQDKERQGIIYERVNGPTMLALANQKPWLVVRLAKQFAELQTEIHKQEVSGLPSQRESLMRVIEEVDDLPDDLKSRVLDLLRTLPDGKALCHFDFHPDQVILTDGGPMVLDWMTAKQGNPLSDVARTGIILKFGQSPSIGWATRTLISLWRGVFYRAYLSRYLALHPGVTREVILDWMVPVAAGRLKENIPGERKLLLQFIRAHLKA
ncbi:MAG: phosphotransferase [Anaerolineaceae bacterium]|nr:phosphotransferase [Anaerolineaceae bacterium]